jgi:hypothetical protein
MEKKLVAGFAIFVGTLMIIMWGIFLITGQVPELETKPIEIVLHITAELMTGSALLCGGVLLWRKHRMGKSVSLFALGMLAYTLIVSPGYYLAQGLYLVGIPFAVLMLIDLICMKMIWKE